MGLAHDPSLMPRAPQPNPRPATPVPAGWAATTLPPAGDGLPAQQMRAPVPRDVIWDHGASAGLAEALIMMVDDEALNSEVTGTLLQEAGYRRFVHTDQPELALAMMRQQVPGILLLDMSMPRVSGLEILAQVREDPLLREVPVIVMTSSTETKLDALAAGATDFLLKPVDASELSLRIRNALAAHEYREHLAQHDPLTGLPNKLRYRKAVAEVVALAQEAGTSGALLHVGVDGLGRINDALGRGVGDQVLQRLAKRLEACVQTEAAGELSSQQHDPSLYRHDGDEFAVLVPHVDGLPSAAAFISKLLEDGTVRFRRGNAPEVFVTCSIGVTVFPTDGTDPDILMRNAGLALHHAKRARDDRYEFFVPRFNQDAVRRLDLGAELRGALEREQIELLFEPRVELAGGRLAAAQAQLRWKHASGRVIEGDELMDLAGTSDMDLALTGWLFDRVRRHLRDWQAAGHALVPVGVKAPLAHIQPRELAHLVNAALGAGLDPRLLCIELQQVEGMANRDALILTALRVKGVRFALDRFGATASVGHLRQMMVDEIRVDPSFTQALAEGEEQQDLLLGLGDLARRLRLACVATGIDDGRQLAFLRAHEWPQGQGAAIGAALGANAFAQKWLAGGQRS